jgi:hypothetical protein
MRGRVRVPLLDLELTQSLLQGLPDEHCAAGWTGADGWEGLPDRNFYNNPADHTTSRPEVVRIQRK